jgi:uncharacterized coiled-coil protein SlyX
MTGRDAEGLIARIRQVRRLAALRAQPASAVGAPQTSASEVDARNTERLGALEARVAHLEQLIEGLQDSVHRESDRHEKLIADVYAKIQPGAMGASLADDARNRGL